MNTSARLTPIPPHASLPSALAAIAWADGFLDLPRVAALLAVAREYGAKLPALAFTVPPAPLDPMEIPWEEHALVIEATSALAGVVGSPTVRETAAELRELLETRLH
jgi:hypothetical protein